MSEKLLDISTLEPTKLKRKKKKKVFTKPSKKSINTGPEKKVQKILKKLGIGYVTQFQVETKFYDIYIPSKNILLEVDGLYWHGQDIEYTKKNKTQKKAFKNDLIKDGLATFHGYIIKRIREDEITESKVKELIYEKIEIKSK